MSCEFVFDDGAYVLGALGPAERAAYEKHLAGCSACREAVANIAVLPGLLRRLTPLEAQEPLDALTDRLPRLTESINLKRAKQKRRERWRVAGSAVLAGAAALIVGIVLMTWRGSPPAGPPVVLPSGPPMVAMTPVAQEAHVTAELGFTETAAGVEVVMHCAYPMSSLTERRWTLRLYALGADGMSEQVGSWTAGPGDEVTITGTSRYRLSDLVRIELRGREGSVLLAYDLP